MFVGRGLRRWFLHTLRYFSQVFVFQCVLGGTFQGWVGQLVVLDTHGSHPLTVRALQKSRCEQISYRLNTVFDCWGKGCCGRRNRGKEEGPKRVQPVLKSDVSSMLPSTLVMLAPLYWKTPFEAPFSEHLTLFSASWGSLCSANSSDERLMVSWSLITSFCPRNPH